MPRLLAWMVALVSAAAIGVVGGAAPACACSCLPVTERQAFAQADAVFIGTVVRRLDPKPHPETSADPVRLKFAVHAAYKGGVRQYQWVRTAYSSASCGLEVRRGDRYLIFADRDHGKLLVSLCGGSRPESGTPWVAGRPPIRTWLSS